MLRRIPSKEESLLDPACENHVIMSLLAQAQWMKAPSHSESLIPLQCSPATCDFGVMIVGTSKYCHISLSNPGPCDLNYSLSITDHSGDVSGE
jgi:hypothetical protein